MSFDEYRHLTFALRDRVLTVTIDRPDVMNAVNARLHQELSRVFVEVAESSDSDVVVLTGAGDAFSAGGDFEWMRDKVANPVPFAPQARATRAIIHGILDCPKPIVARVNGDAIGLGASMALMCDIIVASDTARFVDPHVRAGLVAGDGGAMIWPQLLGFPKAKEYLLTGNPISAPEAERFGMINRCVPLEELDATVDNYVAQLARGAQTAIRYTKSATNIALKQLFNSVYEVALAYQGVTLTTAEHQEGVNAFLERRRPDFRGLS